LKFWERPDFVALQAEWYARLAASGFEDVELGPPLDPRFRHDKPRAVLAAIADEGSVYSRFIAENLQRTSFRNGADEIIMRMRADGAKIREICEHLAEAGTPRRRQAVRYRIRIYEMKWGLRSYSPRQLGRKIG
jgi:hypothetical protein